MRRLVDPAAWLPDEIGTTGYRASDTVLPAARWPELAGVTGVERLPAAPGRACFALAGTGFAEELAPAAAAAVARAGLSLYGLGPEARDLEKIFRDINLHDGREQ